MVDKWLADLKQGKILSERDLKSLCEKVKEICLLSWLPLSKVICPGYLTLRQRRYSRVSTLL